MALKTSNPPVEPKISKIPRVQLLEAQMDESIEQEGALLKLLVSQKREGKELDRVYYTNLVQTSRETYRRQFKWFHAIFRKKAD